MKKIKEMHENGFYVLEGINCANTHLIESQRELDQFFIFADGHLRNYVDIYDYCVTPVGWNILVQIKDEATIFEQYAKSQERKGKSAVFDKIWLILSNQIRLLRHRMTKWTNKLRGREGNASKTTYGRYVFTSLEEGQEYIASLREQELDLDQPNSKYEANKAHYDTKGEIAKNVGQLSSKVVQESGDIKLSGFRSLKISDYVNSALERWIRKTCALHGVAYEEVRVRYRG